MIDQTRAALRSRLRIPAATYRLQLNEGFRFADTERVLPYLHELGITHIYPSPYLRSRPGSKHGYDISNHGELNPELGGADDYRKLVERLRSLNMRQLFDMVPNHMGILGNNNTWWLDILENGPSSAYAQYFDIDWYSALKPELHERVLLPILGSSYGEALESGELRVRYENGIFTVHYFEHCFPIAPCSTDRLLQRGAEQLAQTLSADTESWNEYQSIVTAVKNLPKRNETKPERLDERTREKEVIRRRLEKLATQSEPVQKSLKRTIEEFNGVAGKPESFDLLDDLLYMIPVMSARLACGRTK